MNDQFQTADPDMHSTFEWLCSNLPLQW